MSDDDDEWKMKVSQNQKLERFRLRLRFLYIGFLINWFKRFKVIRLGQFLFI